MENFCKITLFLSRNKSISNTSGNQMSLKLLKEQQIHFLHFKLWVVFPDSVCYHSVVTKSRFLDVIKSLNITVFFKLFIEKNAASITRFFLQNSYVLTYFSSFNI